MTSRHINDPVKSQFDIPRRNSRGYDEASRRAKRDAMTTDETGVEIQFYKELQEPHVVSPRGQRGRPQTVLGRVPPTVIGRTEIDLSSTGYRAWEKSWRSQNGRRVLSWAFLR